MAIEITIDLDNGLTMPDHKVSDWVESKIAESQKRGSTLHLTIGSNIIFLGFRYWVKKKALGTGFVKIKYTNGVTDDIDADGNISYVLRTPDPHNTFLMGIF